METVEKWEDTSAAAKTANAQRRPRSRHIVHALVRRQQTKHTGKIKRTKANLDSLFVY
jgi:hypothetical protein